MHCNKLFFLPSIGYYLTSKDLTTNKTSLSQYSKTVNTRLDKELSNVQYGTRLEFTVATDVQNAQSSNVVTGKGYFHFKISSQDEKSQFSTSDTPYEW